ncbi:MAG TPA: hypothetical protein VD837_19215, partial [Terriglobales bacterium]|nr:hypothetical protein [Terriglobales bacterium]
MSSEFGKRASDPERAQNPREWEHPTNELPFMFQANNLRHSRNNIMVSSPRQSLRGEYSRMVLRFFKLLRLAVWRAFNHDAFGVAKGAAYSSIISLFPALLVIASTL